MHCLPLTDVSDVDRILKTLLITVHLDWIQKHGNLRSHKLVSRLKDALEKRVLGNGFAGNASLRCTFVWFVAPKSLKMDIRLDQYLTNHFN